MAREKNTSRAGTRLSGSRRLSLGRSGRQGGTATGQRDRPRIPGAGRSSATRAQKRLSRREKLTQLRTAFTLTRKADPRLVPLMAIAFLVPFALLLLLGIAVGHPYILGFLGFMLALLAMTAMFGRRVQKHALGQVEGQIGAAAAVLKGMRGDWRVTPAVGFTREQDLVHRVVGRPGIVLVGEGAPSRTRSLLVTEKKRLARFVGDVPVYDLLVGDADGEAALRALEKHFAKLPRNVKPKDVNILDRKLKAMAPALPIPKGPVPGGGRMPRPKQR